MGDGPPVVEDDDVVREAVGLLEVLGGEDQGRTVSHEVAQRLPERLAAEGVEPGRGLVEEQHPGRCDEACREVEPATHPARVGLDEPVSRVGKAELVEQGVGASTGGALRQTVQAADQLEVEPAVEQAVDRRLLGGDADRATYCARLGDDVEPGH